MNLHQIITGNCLEVLPTLEEGSVQVCCTSPPYYAVRSYGTEPVVWGGDPSCDHEFGPEQPGHIARFGGKDSLSAKQTSNRGTEALVGVAPRSGGQFCQKCVHGTHEYKPPEYYQNWLGNFDCAPCGAWLGELGQEPTSDLFVSHLVQVFREVRRVLHPTGLLFLNLADSRAGSGKGRMKDGTHSKEHGTKHGTNVGTLEGTLTKTSAERAPRSPLGIPDRVKEALVADGWILVSAMVLWKKNPMTSPARGPRWVNCYKKVKKSTIEGSGKQAEVGGTYAGFNERWKAQKMTGPVTGDPSKDRIFRSHSGGVGNTPSPAEVDGEPAEWVRCPGCKKCELNGGRILKKGGGRPTDAYEMLYVLAKSQDYFYSTESVRKETGGNCLNHLQWKPAPLKEKHYACVDEETEMLTQRGWVRHSDLLVGETVASYSPADECLRWRPLLAVNRYPYDGELVSAGCASLDMRLTSNHRCVVKRQNTKAGGLRPAAIKRADELCKSDNIPTTAPWDAGGQWFDPAWAELLGWYIAEGHEPRTELSVEIYQSRTANPKKVDRLCDLLRQVGADWDMIVCKRVYAGRETEQCVFKVRGFTAAKLRSLAPSKEIPATALCWDEDAVRALMAGLIAGDGVTRKDDGRMSFIQKNRRTADMVQALAVRLGWSALVTERKIGGYPMCVVYFTKHNTRGLRGTNGSGKGAEITRVPYRGTVWCPSVADGAWVARRNGHVFVTGNSFPPFLPTWCLDAGCPEWCCAKCGTAYAPVIDGDTHDEEAPEDREWQKACGGDDEGEYHGEAQKDYEENGAQNASDVKRRILAGMKKRTVVDWWPICKCDSHTHRWPEPRTYGPDERCLDCHGGYWDPDITRCRRKPVVLDPFVGSGTTLKVAREKGLPGIGVDAQPDYAPIAHRRLAEVAA